MQKFRDLKKFGILLISVILLFVVILFVLLQIKNKTLKQLKYQQDQNLSILDTLHKQKNEIQEQSLKLKGTNLELEKLSLVAKKTDNTILIADIDGDVVGHHSHPFGTAVAAIEHGFGGAMNNINVAIALARMLASFSQAPPTQPPSA